MGTGWGKVMAEEAVVSFKGDATRLTQWRFGDCHADIS